MRSRFDQFAKQVLREVLAPDGVVETDAEVSPDAQRVDLWFVPNPGKRRVSRPLSLLARLTEGACLLEPFHTTPGPDELIDCTRKHLAFRHVLSLRDTDRAAPRMWVISSGRPRTGLPALGFRPLRGWPRGVHEAPPAFLLGLVVVSDLPTTRATLLFRLMGAGRVLKHAIAELRGLPDDAPERAAALPVLLRLRVDVPAEPEQRTREDEEFLMNTQDVVDGWWRQAFKEGVEKGEQLGVEQGLEKGLATARHTFLLLYEARFGRISRALRAVVERSSDPEQITRWSDITAHGEQAEIDAALAAEKKPASRPRAPAAKKAPARRAAPSRAR